MVPRARSAPRGSQDHQGPKERRDSPGRGAQQDHQVSAVTGQASLHTNWLWQQLRQGQTHKTEHLQLVSNPSQGVPWELESARSSQGRQPPAGAMADPGISCAAGESLSQKAAELDHVSPSCSGAVRKSCDLSAFGAEHSLFNPLTGCLL